MRSWPERWVERDRRWALSLHRAAARPAFVRTMALVSVLSDGALWYALMLLVPFLGGPMGPRCALHMLALGTLNLLIYRVLKQHIGRPRPFVECPDIRACARVLDRFSFPSGHTLHAVSYGILLSHHYPAFTWPLATFAALVAVSRVVLGLHYPSDVAAGALIGALTIWLALMAWA
jgi:undecaprenyl-diphosphatase